MSETQQEGGMSFGITEDLSASNKTPFKPGIQAGALTEVKAYEKVSKKGDKYEVLEFLFVDLKGVATYDKIEFAVTDGDEKKVKATNVGPP